MLILGIHFFGLADLGGAIAPTGDETFTAQSFISRFGFNYRDSTAAGDLRINIEADFLGNGDRDFQLRHAYGELGNLLVGETWTNSMSIENYPSSVDFQGPAGILFARPTQIRYSADLADGLVGSVSVESAAFASDDPVLTAALSYTGDNYFIKASVLGGRLNTDIGTTEDAYGVQLSGSGQLWDRGSVQLALAQG